MRLIKRPCRQTGPGSRRSLTAAARRCPCRRGFSPDSPHLGPSAARLKPLPQDAPDQPAMSPDGTGFAPHPHRRRKPVPLWEGLQPRQPAPRTTAPRLKPLPQDAPDQPAMSPDGTGFAPQPHRRRKAVPTVGGASAPAARTLDNGVAAEAAPTGRRNQAGVSGALAAAGSRPSLRNIALMPRSAWRMRSWFSIRAKRTWSSP